MKKLAVVIAVLMVLAVVSVAQAWKPKPGNAYCFNWGGICFDPTNPYDCNPELEINPLAKTVKHKLVYYNYDTGDCNVNGSITYFFVECSFYEVHEWVPSPEASARIKELKKLHEERKKGLVK